MPIHDSRQQNNNNDKQNISITNQSSNNIQVNSSSTSSACRVANKSNNSNKNSPCKPVSIGADSAAELDKTLLISINRQANNGGSSTSAMSNLSTDYLIDDDHIDDQETINVGNLIIDLESDLEKEKIENEQQANAKPITCSSTTPKTSTNVAAASSSSSNHSSSSTTSSASSTANTVSFSGNKGNKASSSTESISSISGPGGGKLNQKSSGKNTNAINNSTLDSSNAINSNSNNGHRASGRALFKSSSDERGELKMRITRETIPGKSEHKIVTSPTNQKSPTSSSVNSAGNNIDVSSAYASGYDEAIMQHKSPSSNPSQSLSISSTKECGTSTSIGTITEPECLGPCEPGTSVTLEGIVWQETDGGILVVNVTWRGKTYVGALLDCTKHDWAPPRLCDSPASDIDSKTSKGVRTKRIVTRSNGIGLDEKNLLQTTGKLRNGKGRRILAPSDLASCSKRQRDSEKSNENLTNTQVETNGASSISSITYSENSSSVPVNIDTAPNDTISTSNITTDKAGPNSPLLIGCNEPNCSKKYRNMNGLLYHQTHAHSNDNDSSNSALENNCSSSIKSREIFKDDQSEETTTTPIESKAPTSPDAEAKLELEVQKLSAPLDVKSEHSPNHRAPRQCKEPAPDINMSMNVSINQEMRTPVVKKSDPCSERRNSSNSGHIVADFGRKSPSGSRHAAEYASGSPSLKQSSSGVSRPQLAPAPAPAPAPLPPTTEEGMKPSGTSTGPPPAPHQANCYFNPAFLANNFNPYLSPYFPRMPPLCPATSNAFLSRFMRPPPLPGGSPHLRMPSQGDPLLPPTSQAPLPPPPSLNPLLGLPGSLNPMGPSGGPQVPSLVDDTLAKQFPRRYN